MQKDSIMRFLHFLQRWGDRIFAVVGAFVFSQFPLFFQQYLHQLSGRLAELRWQMELLQRHLSDSGRSMGEYLSKLLNYPDGDVQLQGSILKELIGRFEQNQQAYLALDNATVWTKPFLFVKFATVDSLSLTAEHFQPGILFTVEGLTYAGIGLVLGCLAFKTLQYLCRGVSHLLRQIPLLLHRPLYE